MEIERDRKGSCWILSHKRSGYYECIFVTVGELKELVEKIKALDI